MRPWWHLPGPRSFVEATAGDLREGRHPILLLPEHGPQENDLFPALAREWEEHGPIESIRAEPGQEPLLLLAQRYEVAPAPRLTTQTLVECHNFAGRVLRLDDIDSASWPAWRSFLEEYEHAARNVGLSERTLFIVPLVGTVAAEPPSERIGFSVRRWQGVVDELDMLLFAAQLLRSRAEPPRLVWLLAATVAQAALFDPEVAQRLAELSTDLVLEPTGPLLEVARDRGWKAETPASWENGTAMIVAGHERAHSALKALNGDVRRRLWRAQVSVLFPVIEEHRQRLIETLGQQLRIPFETGAGTVEDTRYLEIGHIAIQVDRFRLRVSRETRLFIGQLKTLRDRLAHLDPAPLEMIQKTLFFPGDDAGSEW